MAASILLLRGINLGPSRRVPMAELREVLSGAGFEDVQTYVQSGNVVLSTSLDPDELAARASTLIGDRFGFEVPVVVRTGEELASVVALNPLGDVATNPKRYQVSFLSAEPDHEAVSRLLAAAVPGEELVAIGRELYAWHPDGVARSKLWAALASGRLGVTATARNWTTVETLAKMAQST